MAVEDNNANSQLLEHSNGGSAVNVASESETPKRPLEDALESETKKTKVDDSGSTEVPEATASTDVSAPVDVTVTDVPDAASALAPATEEGTTGENNASNGVETAAPAPVTTPMVPAPKPPSEPDMNNLPANPMPKHQQKYAVNTIKAIRRLKDAGPFLQPVDIVKLNIPFYYNYIPRPMDLGTIERKIQADAYESPDGVVADFNLMVENCIKFNGKDSGISQMARNIQASFEKHFLNMPPKDLPQAPTKAAKGGRRKTTDGTDVPLIRRDTISSDTGRPKREIHPPKPKDMPYDIRPKKKKFQAELRFCQQTIKELLSKKYDSISYPFIVPVDPVALDCPTYFDIVKEPMDLGTILSKIQNGQYETGDDFARDVKLVFSNCYAFNPEGSVVNMMGHRLEAVFDEKWKNRPVAPPTPPQQNSDDEESEAEEEEEEEEFNVDINSITDPTIEFLVANIERMTNDLNRMRQEKYEQLRKEWLKKKKSKKSKTKSGKKKRTSSTSYYPTTVTYDMKKEISEAMSKINDKMLKSVIAIIREGVPDLADDEEIELDMDQLENETLLKLYNFIVKGKGKNGSASVKKKKAQSEEKKIENIKKKLEQFQKAEKKNGPESDSDEDDDDDSGESSEEE